MLENLFDLFDRDKKQHGPRGRKRSFMDRVSSMLEGDDDDRSHRSSDRRYSDDDDIDRDDRRYDRRSRRDGLFDLD